MFKNQHLTRQLDLIPVECLGERITVVGAGAIGGWLTLALAKMGFCNLTVYDFDKIEIENMNAQLYRFKDIGKPKVEALKDLVEDFTQVKINAVNGRFPNVSQAGIVVSAVDNMKTRKEIWEAHRGLAPMTKAVIDPRMGAEVAQCYVINPMSDKDIKMYEKTLYSDDNSVHERCTAKATIYTANLLAGHVAQQVKEVASKGNYARTMQWSIKDYQMHSWRLVPVGVPA